MSMLGRLWRWLEPGLIYVDPMVAIVCSDHATDVDTPSAEPDSNDDFRVSTVTSSDEKAHRYLRLRPFEADLP